MTKDELLVQLRNCIGTYDQEKAHVEADDALLAFINDPEITEAYNAIEKWYA